MTLTVRSSSVAGAVTASRALTHAEMDANWEHVLQSSNQSFTPSGIGAIAETVMAALRRFKFAVQYGTLAQAITACDGGTLYIDTNLTVSANTTFPATLTTEFKRGGKLTIATGVAVTFEGDLIAPRAQIFDCADDGFQVVLEKGTDIYPEWFAADPTGTNDSAEGLQFAFDASRKSLTPSTLDGLTLQGQRGSWVSFAPNAIYKCLSALWAGWSTTVLNGVTATDRAVPGIRGNGAVIYGVHTGYILDYTGGQLANLRDFTLHGDSTTIPKAGLFMARRNTGLSAGRRYCYDITISGSYSIAGFVNWASEDNEYHAFDFRVAAGMAVVLTQTGRWWDGSAWQTLTVPNADSGHSLGVESPNGNFFYRSRFASTKAAPSGLPALVQIVSCADTLFHAGFFDDTANDMPAIQTIRDSGGSGDVPNGLEISGNTLFHSVWESAVEVNGQLQRLQIEPSTRFGTLSVAALVSKAAATITGVTEAGRVRMSKVHVPSIDFSAANSDFFQDNYVQIADGSVAGSINIAREAAGLFVMPATTTKTFGGSNFQKRGAIIETDTGRRYRISDVVDNTDTSTSGTGADNLKSFIATASGGVSMLGTTGGLRVRAGGTKTTGGGNKTITLVWGSTSYTVHPAANNVLNWTLEAEIFNAGATNAQRGWIRFWNDNTLVYADYITATEDTTASVTLKLTGECADAGDTITQTMWSVERI